MTSQLQLFNEREQQLLTWQARFERADWIAPEDCADGTPKGAVRSGWRCPDPECGEVEPSAFVLAINHGFDPDVPGRQRFDGRCAQRPLPTSRRERERDDHG